MSYTAEEIKAILEVEVPQEEEHKGWSFYTENGFTELDDLYGSKDTLEYGGVTFKVIEEWGGEGQGERYGLVVQVGEQLFKLDAYYSSYEGSNWEDPYVTEVRPQEVTVIQYVAV